MSDRMVKGASFRCSIVTLLIIGSGAWFVGSEAKADSPPMPRKDTSHLIRIWNVDAGAKPGENRYTRTRAVGQRMILTTNVTTSADMRILASMGYTLFQTDSNHLSTEEKKPGVWVFKRHDNDMNRVHNLGLDWCYFPHYDFPPPWYDKNVPYVRISDREDHKSIPAFSPWYPKWPAFVHQGYQELKQHFDDQISGLYLGVSGDYGECGLFMGARLANPGQRADWIRRFGNAPDHLGWWCNDPDARANFKSAMLKKYGSLDALNQAWGTSFPSANEITYPKSPKTDSRRYWLDYVNWYMHGVDNAVDMVCRAARSSFPNTMMMLPVGFGDENPRGGNDNSMIPKIAARYHVDVRSTHGGFKPFAANAASMLGRIGSACRFYGVPFWTEPPSAISPDQEVGRIFESISEGAKGFFDWAGNSLGARDVFYHYGKYMKIEQPVVDVAMFYPTTSHLLQPDVSYPTTLLKGCTQIRAILNYDIVDERMIRDGALSHYRILVMWEGTVVPSDVLNDIRRWVQGGGVLVAYDFGKIETISGDLSWYHDLFGYIQQLQPAYVGADYKGDLPTDYRLQVADPSASNYLSGHWHDAETDSSGTWRWTAANATLFLPVNPIKNYTLTLIAIFPTQAEALTHQVFLNGHLLGDLNASSQPNYTFSVPATWFNGDNVAHLTFKCETFVPAETIPGSNDNRNLGIRVQSVEMTETGTTPIAQPTMPPGRLTHSIDTKLLLTQWAHRYGNGWTVFFPATKSKLTGYEEVVRFLTYHLSRLDPTKRDAIPVNNHWNGVYATLFTDKALYYNPTDKPVTVSFSLTPQLIGEWENTITIPTQPIQPITIQPNGIGAIYFTPPPQELLFQCEKFTDLGGASTVSDPGCNPGTGVTAVQLDADHRTISTRFMVNTPGAYTIFVRTKPDIAAQSLTVLFDGKSPTPSLESNTATPDILSAYPPDTVNAGTVQVSQGVHSLQLTLTAGSALADFVILTDDPTIAGYAFPPATTQTGQNNSKHTGDKLTEVIH